MMRRVVGESMQPTLKPGAVVMGWRFKRPRVGDIVIAAYNGREIIKRVSQRRTNGYYVVGDNQNASTDSRTFGYLEPSAIKAVVIGATL